MACGHCDKRQDLTKWLNKKDDEIATLRGRFSWATPKDAEKIEDMVERAEKEIKLHLKTKFPNMKLISFLVLYSGVRVLTYTNTETRERLKNLYKTKSGVIKKENIDIVILSNKKNHEVQTTVLLTELPPDSPVKFIHKNGNETTWQKNIVANSR